MTYTSVKSSTFSSTVGSFPITDFTNLNGNSGELTVASAGFFHSPYVAASDGRARGTFSVDQYAQITLTGFTRQSGTPDEIGVGLRLGTDVNPNGDGYRIRVADATTSTLKVYAVTNNSESVQVGATVTGNWSNGDVLLAEIIGTTITVYKNGVSVFSATDSTFSGAAGSPNGGGSPGICGKMGGDTQRGSVFDSGDATASSARSLFRTNPSGNLSGLGSSGSFFQNPLQ